MLGFATGLKDLDNDHAATAAGARMSVGGGHVLIDLVGVWIYAGDKQVACLGDRVGFGGTGEQAVVADAMETLGQDVQEEATDELRHLQRHSGVATQSLDPVILD